MPQKVYLYILKGGILASFLSFLLVFNSLLFPFITSKQIYFNILIELLFVVWLAFIAKYPQWRPKLSYICYGILAYFAVILASCFVSVDFNLSFWGDIERMLGFFHLAHFLAFYFIVITVMKEWKDWRLLFIASLVITLIVSIKAIAGSPESTIGNKAYVAGLLIFNIYFALLLFFRDRTARPFAASGRPVRYLHWLYLIPVIFFLWAFREQGITGAQAGLGLSIIVLVFFLGVLNKRKAVKIGTVVAAVAVIIGASAVVADKKEAIGEYFAGQDTFQTRLIAWKGAWQGFGDHPILGTGYGTFAITFDKYFDADFYDYAMHGATFFDRAHNNLVDIASTTGTLGVITYLSIFLALLYYLIVNYRQGKIHYVEFSLIIALVAGYFVQNLAVFDSLVTYVSLFSLLGFVYWLHSAPGDSGVTRALIAETGDKKLIDREIYALAGVGIVILFVIFQYNIQTWQMLTGTIDGQRAFARNNITKATEEYKQALSYNSPLNRDSRASYVDSMVSSGRVLQQMSAPQREEILDYALELVRANTAYNPQDTITQMKMARINHLAARFHSQSSEDFAEYMSAAMEAVNKAIASSPERIPTYLLKAQLQLTQGDTKEAIETIEYTLTLDEDYYDSYCYLARLYLREDETEKGMDRLNKCVDKGGIKNVKDPYVLKKAINYYLSRDNYSQTITYYEQLAQVDNDNAEVWMKLARLYAIEGQTEEAKQAAQKAADIDSSVQAEVRAFIQQLEEGHEFEIGE